MILLVEDEAPVAATVTEMLVAFGYSVLAAADGIEALRVFRKERQSIDLVLLDLVMPGMAGEEVLAALRELDSEVPIVISSGYRLESDLVEELGADVNGFLSKPYAAEALAAKLREILDGR